MIDRMFRDVSDFHTKFHIAPRFAVPTPIERFPGGKGLERIRHMQEELDELKASLGMGVAPQADALADLVYLALGTAIAMGLPWAKVWDAVHYANMKKVSGTGPKQVTKPAGWQDPRDEIAGAIADATGTP